MVRLVDLDGHVVLGRLLQAETQSIDCAALADTVALIVERDFDELEVRRLDAVAAVVPNSPVARSTWGGGVTVVGRSGQGSLVSPGVGVFVERGVHGRLHWTLSLSAGITSAHVTAAAAATKRDESWCLFRAGPWWGQGTNRFGLQAALGVGLVRARRAGEAANLASAWGAEPWTGLSARYRAWWRDRWFAEASLGGFVAIVRHELVVTLLPEQMRRVVATTPRVFADLGLSLGLQF